MLMVSERLGPLSSCSSSLCRSAVLVWMLLSSCSLRCLISSSSSLRSTEPEEGTETGSWVAPLDSAERNSEGEGDIISLLLMNWRQRLQTEATVRQPGVKHFIEVKGEHSCFIKSTCKLFLLSADSQFKTINVVMSICSRLFPQQYYTHSCKVIKTEPKSQVEIKD